MTAQATGAAHGRTSVIRAWDMAERLRGGDTLEQIAADTGLTVGTVKTRLGQAGFRTDGQQRSGDPIPHTPRSEPTQVLTGAEREAALRAAGLPVGTVAYSPPRAEVANYTPPYTRAQIEAAAKKPRCQSCKTNPVARRGTLCPPCQRLADDYEHTAAIPVEPQPRPDPTPDRVGGAEHGPSHTRPEPTPTATESPAASAPDTPAPAGAPDEARASGPAPAGAHDKAVRELLGVARSIRGRLDVIVGDLAALERICARYLDDTQPKPRPHRFDLFDAEKQLAARKQGRTETSGPITETSTTPRPDRRETNGGRNRVLDDTEVARRYTAGEDAIQIAKHYGVGKTAVYRALDRVGVERVRRPRPTTRKDIDVDQVVAMYNGGLSVPRIAEELGLYPKLVRDRLKERADVVRRDDRATNSGGRNKVVADPPELVDAVRGLYLDEQLTVDDVAARLGLGSHKVSNVLDRAGVPRRPPANTPGHGGRDQKTSETQRVEICDRYTAGESALQLARAFGLSTASVYTVLHNRGVAVRGTAEANAARRGTAGKDGSAALRDRIAELGLTSKILRAWANAHGVECPRLGTVPYRVLDAWEAAHA